MEADLRLADNAVTEGLPEVWTRAGESTRRCVMRRRVAADRRLAAGDGADDEKRLRPARYRFGQGMVGRFEGPILAAGKKSQEGPALQGDVVADGAAQHGVASLERVQNGALGDLAVDLDAHLGADVRQRAQMRREYNSNHGSVCTSTESTAGRLLTMGAQLSPASREAYTCPPVVPKYTPHESSESTAMASRNTFT